MNIENITLNHSITIDEYNNLRASVDFITIRENRAHCGNLYGSVV